MPQAVIMDGCVVGDRVTLHPGAVIGADGFGYVQTAAGLLKVPQVGRTVLEDDVEVGANSCVDRASMGETRVGRGARLDNLVQVAHGVRIGADALLAAFAGVAGSARVGARAVLAGRASVVEGVVIGDDVMLAGLAAVARDLPDGARVGGAPARGYRDWLREQAAVRRLPSLLRTVDRLERRFEEVLRDRS
jgi:UDP-3-O-[3-hydroxymyristoyl] glucosamine N-acyltransferase